ncbi:hypothetical protein BJ138DRAFT_734122 [Hygrophoropsis aurantiaca]|uniref:Uncharacterized protein n=1 Tax=Hygrophoropsis aurantiaca TaxID=72124 RepID=A0ACB8AIS2_9AGAM|nr:hypothetical protein BJ138DRAFT_734122 [Hygrophoropsis aurantiaca]
MCCLVVPLSPKFLCLLDSTMTALTFSCQILFSPCLLRFVCLVINLLLLPVLCPLVILFFPLLCLFCILPPLVDWVDGLGFGAS